MSTDKVVVTFGSFEEDVEICKGCICEIDCPFQYCILEKYQDDMDEMDDYEGDSFYDRGW